MNQPNLKNETIRILLVEDNPNHAELVKRSLNRLQVKPNLFHVSDGEEALDYLYQRKSFADKEAHPAPNLILLDLRLPKVSGLEVLRQIKREEALLSIPVVVLTTSKADNDILHAYQNHANSYLVKPVDYLQFSNLMKDIGFYWLGWNQYT